MSAYSEYKCGAITEDEYNSLARIENHETFDEEKHGCFDCFYRDSCDSKGYYCPVKEGDWE